MTYAELFAQACAWHDGECRKMRFSAEPYNCCYACRFYDGAPCPLEKDKPRKCGLYLCHAAEFWIAEQGSKGRADLLEAYGRLKADLLLLGYGRFAARKGALGLGGAFHTIFRKKEGGKLDSIRLFPRKLLKKLDL